MKTIGMAAFLILSAQWAFASDFNLPTLKYDLREPGSLPSAPASGKKSAASLFEIQPLCKQETEVKVIPRDGIVSPVNGTDYKMRILKAPKVDQDIIKNSDSKR